MKFTKMHGAGNDYVYVNCFEEPVADPGTVAEFVSDRHKGIGSDGLVLICPSDTADFQMRMFNADGSEGKMCGNAIRCVGKYVYDNRMTDKTDITIETLSGIKTLRLDVQSGKVVYATVNMGKAVLRPRDIPINADGDTFVNQRIKIARKKYRVTGVSMGNPHIVTFTDSLAELNALNLAEIGPLFENHPLFPERINTEFVYVESENVIHMRVWERGSGETMACGTGACASVVACALCGYAKQNEQVIVHLRGGELRIMYADNGEVIMRGGAATVFTGEL